MTPTHPYTQEAPAAPPHNSRGTAGANLVRTASAAAYTWARGSCQGKPPVRVWTGGMRRNRVRYEHASSLAVLALRTPPALPTRSARMLCVHGGTQRAHKVVHGLRNHRRQLGLAIRHSILAGQEQLRRSLVHQGRLSDDFVHGHPLHPVGQLMVGGQKRVVVGAGRRLERLRVTGIVMIDPAPCRRTLALIFFAIPPSLKGRPAAFRTSAELSTSTVALGIKPSPPPSSPDSNPTTVAAARCLARSFMDVHARRARLRRFGQNFGVLPSSSQNLWKWRFHFPSTPLR